MTFVLEQDNVYACAVNYNLNGLFLCKTRYNFKTCTKVMEYHYDGRYLSEDRLRRARIIITHVEQFFIFIVRYYDVPRDYICLKIAPFRRT